MLAQVHLRQRNRGLGAAVLDAGGGKERQRLDLLLLARQALHRPQRLASRQALRAVGVGARKSLQGQRLQPGAAPHRQGIGVSPIFAGPARGDELARIGLGEALHLPEAEAQRIDPRSEEHTSELQSLMRRSYAVFCLKKKKTKY